ncbi:DUF4397 domain-containing protein [Metabacillus herbersteinensis]|uniref:DUF4397 domain-containing protein n=1 Tax=Metabacillus herbersteinensis TaxID=283816 RepID=A0ABV6GLQ6_9BACI
MNPKEKYAHKALMYDMLSNYYKYVDPAKHILYYQKHLKALQQLMSAGQHDHRDHHSQQLNLGMSKVRILHASPDAPSVDIYLNGKVTLKNVTFKQLSDYFQLPAGNYRIDIFPTGNQSRPVLSEMLLLMPASTYTIAASGRASNLKLLPFIDQPFISAGETKVRVVHLSPDAPAVDIAIKDGDVLFKNVSFLDATTFLTVSPRKVDLEVRVAGTNSVVLTVRKVQFKADRAFTVFAVGFANGTPSLDLIITS